MKDCFNLFLGTVIVPQLSSIQFFSVLVYETGITFDFVSFPPGPGVDVFPKIFPTSASRLGGVAGEERTFFGLHQRVTISDLFSLEGWFVGD